MEENYKQKLRNVSAFIFDVDGVLTDGSLLVMPDGDFLRRMNIKDGYALQLAVKKGYKIAVISGGHSPGVPIRLKRLGIDEVHMGVQDKLQVFQEVVQRFGVSPIQVVAMGDDLPDLPVLKTCGVPCCPADAAHEILDICTYVSHYKGGEGCVRDIVEQVLRLHGKWE
jgi:3-deoxy-D-manno-octulosonate 8-phosphate phosphatase (KDO 8-P phosphatase)